MRSTTFTGTNSGKLLATMERYGSGRTTVERIAKACNGSVRIGDTRFYLWDRMDEYLKAQADAQSKTAI